MDIRKGVMVALAQRGMKQKDLAGMVGMSQGSMSQLLGQSSCTLATLEKIATALDMKLSELVALGED